MIGYLNEMKYHLQEADNLVKVIKEKSKYSSIIQWDLVKIKLINNEIILILPIQKLSEFYFQLNMNYIHEVDSEDFEFEEIEDCFVEQINDYKDEIEMFNEVISGLERVK